MAASFKEINEHEGLAARDTDGDGRVDLVGGGYWFRNLDGDRFEVNPIDSGYTFSRAAAGRLLIGEKRAQAVFVVG